MQKKLTSQKKRYFLFLYKKVTQRNDYLSAGGADLSYQFAIQDFVLLNDTHIEKQSIIKLDSQKDSDDLKLFLEESGKLKFEIYSPRF